MQAVYATLQSKTDDLNVQEKHLSRSIEDMTQLKVLLLTILVEIQKLAEEKQQKSKKKFIASDQDFSNQKFIDNRLIKQLRNSKSLKLFIEENKLNNWTLDFEYIQNLWSAIQQSDAYASYLSKSDSFENDKSFVITIFKNIIAPDEKLYEYFEDKNISWVDDIPFINTLIVKELEFLKSEGTYRLRPIYKDEEDKKFVTELYRKVTLNHHKFNDLINEKTPNWESDRIAEVDLILIKMAITEFLYFASIPTRVTINEYIEIAKDYSSQKSSFFINGVLDKLLKEFTDKGEIKKIGRGLM